MSYYDDDDERPITIGATWYRDPNSGRLVCSGANYGYRSNTTRRAMSAAQDRDYLRLYDDYNRPSFDHHAYCMQYNQNGLGSKYKEKPHKSSKDEAKEQKEKEKEKSQKSSKDEAKPKSNRKKITVKKKESDSITSASDKILTSEPFHVNGG